jgi:hypothetical protein
MMVSDMGDHSFLEMRLSQLEHSNLSEVLRQVEATTLSAKVGDAHT